MFGQLFKSKISTYLIHVVSKLKHTLFQFVVWKGFILETSNICMYKKQVIIAFILHRNIKWGDILHAQQCLVIQLLN